MITTARVRERARGIFYGWWIVAAAFGVQVLQSALLMQSFGAYVSVLQEQFGWSKGALSGAFSLQRIETGMLGPLQGWLLNRFGPRKVMRVGIVIFGSGLMLFSQINAIWNFYAVFFLIAIGASLSGFMSITTTLVNWFSRRRATAMGVAQMGMSVGGLLVPVVAYSLTQYGWRATAFYSGVIVIAVGLPLTQIMRSHPEDHGELPDGDPPEPAVSGDGESNADSPSRDPLFTTRQALRTRAFWFLSIGHGCAVLVVSAVMVHLIVHLNEGLNYSLTEAAAFVSLMTIMQMIGLPFGGFLGDKFDKRKIAILAMFGHSGALLILAYATTVWMVIVFAVMHGIAWGMRGPLMHAMRADYFGRRAFAQVMGFSSLIVMMGMTGGPLIAGIMADRLGNYQLGFTILAIAAAIGSLFFMFATKPDIPQPEPAE
ncbi:MAG: MFS transporter [Chloroflexota bacterium]